MLVDVFLNSMAHLDSVSQHVLLIQTKGVSLRVSAQYLIADSKIELVLKRSALLDGQNSQTSRIQTAEIVALPA